MLNLSSGVLLSLQPDQLCIKLDSNDILDPYNFADSRDYLGCHVVHTYRPDNTNVRLTLSYSLPTKQRYRAKVDMEGVKRLV